MNAPPILQRRRALRWLVPAGVAGVAALAATGVFRAGASDQTLPRTSPAALLAAVKQPIDNGFSGTLVSHVTLGLPQLPSFGGDGDTADDASMTSLLSGSHTLQVWYAGVDRQRIALLGATEETDVFRDGRDLWQWTSADHTAIHSKVPTDGDRADGPSAAATTLTPAGLASSAIAAMNPTTKVTVDKQRNVADRAAYELVLTPRSDATKVGAVHIEVDGKTKVPLGVQVYARNASEPAIDVAFTTIHFGPQVSRNFAFTPPPDAKVVQHSSSTGSSVPDVHRAAAKSVGAGWTTVLALRPGKRAVAQFSKGVFAKATTAVSGSWGRGRLLDTSLFAVLITDDGRVYAGTVDPTMLYSAAAK